METSDIAAIEFSWERVKERASLKIDKLSSNNPKVITRDIPVTATTDMLVEPVIDIGSKRLLLPDTNLEVEDDGPDKNVIAIIKGIKNKEITGKDITVDERRMVVNSLKLSGQGQDNISEILGVSRRTIVSDYKVLRQQQALAIQNTDTTEIAGEVYEIAKTCIRKAMVAGHYKTVSGIMRDMVELLQSMGLVYRAPKASVQANLHGQLSSKQGYHKYMDAIGEDKGKVVEVLDCMFEAISNNQVN
jgi:transposase